MQKTRLVLVADMQLYKRHCPSIGPSVRRCQRVKKWENERFGRFLCMGVGHGVRMGVGRPCPPVRNDIVTPYHLFLSVTLFRRDLDINIE